MLFFWIALFLISLALLIKAADYFTNFSEKIGIALGLSPFIVGVTIVSIGTSLPELASSVLASLSGNSEIVAANVLGSNIANILLVVGVAAIFAGKLKVKRNIIDLDLPLLVGGSVILLMVLLWDGSISFFEGVISLVAYFIYIRYLMSLQSEQKDKNKKPWTKLSFKLIAGIVVSGLVVAVGANYVIESVVKISEILDVGKAVIGMSAVAIGTSLPELFVAISAARKKNYEVAVGSVFGSNIFNGCVALGLPALFAEVNVSPDTVTIALPFFIAATLLFVISGVTKKIYSWEGWIYVLIYILFIGKIFNLF